MGKLSSSVISNLSYQLSSAVISNLSCHEHNKVWKGDQIGMNSVLTMDRQTDEDTSALVELRLRSLKKGVILFWTKIFFKSFGSFLRLPWSKRLSRIWLGLCALVLDTIILTKLVFGLKLYFSNFQICPSLTWPDSDIFTSDDSGSGDVLTVIVR